jgi:ABC-type branched-subunit amino acid transport system substrate-binding protein
VERRALLRWLVGGAALGALSACSSGIHFGPSLGSSPDDFVTPDDGAALPRAQGETFGTGPVRVALLLPLTGNPSLSTVGISMANASKLAIDFIVQNPNIPDNITVVLKDTGANENGAATAASQAVSEGASLILGPLKAEQVSAAGKVARAAGVPVIGFSNNSGVAGPGVYLLNVLPEVEVRRSLRYVTGKGRQAIAAILPTTDYGRIQEGAFNQAVSDLGLSARTVYEFSSEAEARTAIQQIAPLLSAGQIDTLFIPDRATAPSFGVLLSEAGVPRGKVQIVGSADWNGDANIQNTPFLVGAVFPAVDDAGYAALKGEYQAKFGAAPHALATIAYTATILANASSLALGTPKYDRAQLTIPAGFNGRDGVFRFLPDGRSEYALVIKQVTAGGAKVVDSAKL